MERITKVTYENKTKIVDITDKLVKSTSSPAEITSIVLHKLAEYEDLEEQNRLVKLPCGIGADIYYVPSKTNFRLNVVDGCEEHNRVYHQTVDRIIFIKIGWYMECDSDLEYGTGRILLDTSYQETWFLSQKEAEAKLRELETEIRL